MATLTALERVTHRYRVEAVLGGGGMAAVFRVQDWVTGRRLALKRLVVDPAHAVHAPAMRSAFEREYRTLAQLAHPRVIRVFDYGVDASGPYYTMELLDGADLRELAPLPWQKACAIARDVCHSLALLHARHLLHRDLSPRNVRCTPDGHAKLIDFGAMTAFGAIANELVGTPAYTPPEAVLFRSLDGRADLFALGAVLYYALTRRHAYSAKTIAELELAWEKPIEPIRTFAPDVPAQLEALTMSLLSRDPIGRPATAAEVIVRLSAIASLPEEGDVELAHAHLAAPALVGRAEAQAAFDERVAQARNGAGGALVVSGPPGVGRTRFMSACFVDAKLTGAFAVLLRPALLSERSFAAMHALISDLLDHQTTIVPAALTPQAPVLIHEFPEIADVLRYAVAPIAVATEDELRAETQRALVAFLTALGARAHVQILVDDFDRCDLASRAVLIAVAHESRSTRTLLSLAVTDQDASDQSAVSELAKAELLGQVELRPLDKRETQELLRSVFGDVANLVAVADWVQRISHGNPRTVMELARHLVESRAASLTVDGSWHLPQRLGELALPDSVGQATVTRLLRSSRTARHMAHAIALVSSLMPLTLTEIIELGMAHAPQDDVYAALDELVRLEVLVDTGTTYVFGDRSVAREIEHGLPAEEAKRLHNLLGEIYLQRHDEQIDLIIAYHLYHAGDLARARSVIAAKRPNTSFLTGTRSLFAQTRIAIDFMEGLLLHLEERSPSSSESRALRRLLVDVAAVADPGLVRHAPALIAQLVVETGLVFLPDLDPAMPVHERASECVNRALRVWQSTPEAQRGEHPLRALETLGMAVASLVSVYARTWDADALSALPALIEPFAAIPAMAFIVALIQMVMDSIIVGHNVRAQREALLTRLATTIPGIGVTTQNSARAILRYYVGLDYAFDGNARSLDFAESVESLPTFAALAWHIRSVHHGAAGEVSEAQRCHRRMEMLASREFDHAQHLRVGSVYALFVYVRARDLGAVSRELRQTEREAERFPGWVAWRSYARAAYHFLCGEFEDAEAVITAEPATTLPGRHQAFQHLQTLRVRVLVELGRAPQAKQVADELTQALAQLALRPVDGVGIQIAVALAEAANGAHADALQRLETCLDEIASDLRGIHLGAVHAAVARVALLAGDIAGCERAAQRAIALFRKLQRSELIADCEQLLAHAKAHGAPHGTPGLAAPEVDADVGADELTQRHTRKLRRVRS